MFLRLQKLNIVILFQQFYDNVSTGKDATGVNDKRREKNLNCGKCVQRMKKTERRTWDQVGGGGRKGEGSETCKQSTGKV